MVHKNGTYVLFVSERYIALTISSIILNYCKHNFFYLQDKCTINIIECHITENIAAFFMYNYMTLTLGYRHEHYVIILAVIWVKLYGGHSLKSGGFLLSANEIPPK